MLNKKDILYIKQGNRESIIYTINGVIHINKPIDKLLNEWCLEELTTYSGRMEAIRIKYHLRKLVPVYINKELMLFPVSDKKDLNNIYINSLNVLMLEKQGKNTQIEFINHYLLILNKEYEKVDRYYQRTIDIYYSI